MINIETTQVTYLTRADQTTRYSIPFVYNKNELTDAPELTVTLSGSELAFGTDYTVNESGLQLVSAVEEGLELVITRTSVFEQLRDFQTGLIDPEQIEGGFDDSVMRDQELKRDTQRVADDLATETEERINADTILQDAIDDEANARILADGALQTNIDNEALARSGADTTLQNNIDHEADAREDADAALQASIDTKQDIIPDLATIRNGAAAGAFAVQPEDLAAVATSGSYNDLSNKPTIPSVGAGSITITQGGVTKGSFNVNQSGNTTIDVDVGGGNYTAGTGIDITNDVISVDDPVLVNKTSTANSLVIGESATTTAPLGGTVVVGSNAYSSADRTTAIGWNARAIGESGVAIGTAALARRGAFTVSTRTGGVSLDGAAENEFAFINDNGKFTVISSDGTIPSDRLASGGTVGQILTKSASGMAWNSAPAIDGVQLTSSTTKADLGLSNLYTFKGSVSTYSNLPATGNVVGDVYNVEDTGNNYAWATNGWDSLGGEFTAPVSSVNGMTGAVVLGASDVGALPASGGTMTGNITLGNGANIVPTVSSNAIGSSLHPFSIIYTYTLSSGNQYGRFMIPAADQSTFGFFIALVDAMPTARQDLEAMIFQYMGATDSNYTHGYFYECVTDDNTTWYWKQLDVQPSSGGGSYTAGNGISIDANNEISVADPVLVNRATGTNSVAIGASSGATVANATCVGVWSGSVGAGGVAIGSNAYADTSGSVIINSNPSGNRAGNQDSNTFRWQNANGNYMLFAADGTIPEARLADTTNAQQGDVLTLDSTGNAVWQAGGGGSSYTAGNGIDITNNAISVQMPVKYNDNNAYAIGIVTQLGASVYNSVAIGTGASADTEAVNIGGQGPVPQGTISIGNFQSTPSERGVVLFHTQDSNFNYHTYKMLEADGTVPADRFASTTGLADGNYRLRCTITNGVPTLEWVAE